MDYQGVQQLMGDPSKEGAAVHGLPRTEAQPAPSPLTPLSCARKKYRQVLTKEREELREEVVREEVVREALLRLLRIRPGGAGATASRHISRDM